MTAIFADVRGRTLMVDMGSIGEEERDVWKRLALWDDANGTDVTDVIAINSNGIRFGPGGPVDDVVDDRESFERYVESRGRNDAPLFLGLDDLMESAVVDAVRHGEVVQYLDTDHSEDGAWPSIVVNLGDVYWSIDVLRDLSNPWDRGEILSWACGIEILPRCARTMRPNTERGAQGASTSRRGPRPSAPPRTFSRSRARPET